MKGFGICKRMIGGGNESSKIIGIFDSKYEAKVAMENEVIREIAKKNGADSIIPKQFQLNPKQKSETFDKLEPKKYYQKFNFICDVGEDHGKSSHLWGKLPFNKYFVLRDAREMDKFTVCEKLLLPGIITNSYEAIKVYSLELVYIDFIELGLIENEYKTDKYVEEKTEEEIEEKKEFLRKFSISFMESPKYNEMKTLDYLQLDVENSEHYI